MRWNCPHCEELVTAGIDFESTKKMYVRCAKCSGMALIHRSAAITELAGVLAAQGESPPPEQTLDIELPPVSPPPFMKKEPTATTTAANGYDPIVESAMAEPPSFAYAKPPAFLLKENPETTTTFAADDEFTETMVFATTRGRRRRNAVAAFFSSNAAVWLAAGLALTSGAYLFLEGRKTLTPIAPESSSAPKASNPQNIEPAISTEAATQVSHLSN
jgi:hypothetical protein